MNDGIEQAFAAVKTVAIILAVIAAAIIVGYIALAIKRRTDAARVLNNGRRNENFVYNLLRTYFPARSIIRNAYIPLTVSQDNRKYVPVDLICVNKGGVAVITLRSYRGKIDNPIRGDWILFGQDQPIPIKNPFEQNVQAVRAVEEILRSENVFNIPICSAVVNVDQNVRFRNKYELLMLPRSVVPRMRDMNHNSFLSFLEISKVAGAIRRNSRECPEELKYQYIRRRRPNNNGNINIGGGNNGGNTVNRGNMNGGNGMNYNGQRGNAAIQQQKQQMQQTRFR